MVNFRKLLSNAGKKLRKQHAKCDLFNSTSRTLSIDLYKSEGYMQQMQVIIRRLEELLSMYENLKGRAIYDKRATKEYVYVHNNIIIEINLLVATKQAMDNNLYALRKKSGFLHITSGRMISLANNYEGILRKLREKVVSVDDGK